MVSGHAISFMKTFPPFPFTRVTRSSSLCRTHSRRVLRPVPVPLQIRTRSHMWLLHIDNLVVKLKPHSGLGKRKIQLSPLGFPIKVQACSPPGISSFPVALLVTTRNKQPIPVTFCDSFS